MGNTLTGTLLFPCDNWMVPDCNTRCKVRKDRLNKLSGGSPKENRSCRRLHADIAERQTQKPGGEVGEKRKNPPGERSEIVKLQSAVNLQEQSRRTFEKSGISYINATRPRNHQKRLREPKKPVVGNYWFLVQGGLLYIYICRIQC